MKISPEGQTHLCLSSPAKTPLSLQNTTFSPQDYKYQEYPLKEIQMSSSEENIKTYETIY